MPAFFLRQQGCSFHENNQISSVAAGLEREEYPLKYVLWIQYQETAMVFILEQKQACVLVKVQWIVMCKNYQMFPLNCNIIMKNHKV